jgi:uncharacterized protein YtpQ (UPF0354 family)
MRRCTHGCARARRSRSHWTTCATRQHRRSGKSSPGTYIAQFGDHYDAARILLPDLAWQLTLTGNPVAIIPTRDCLVITGEDDETGQALMLALAQQAVEGTTRHLTGEMFRLEDSQWKVWLLNSAEV